MRLINADALEKAIYEWMPKDQETWMDSEIPPIENLVVSIMMTIQEQPTVETEPVRHGKWIYGNDFHWYTASCNKCGYQRRTDIKADRWNQWNYCPNCGAKMDEVENETD